MSAVSLRSTLQGWVGRRIQGRRPSPQQQHRAAATATATVTVAILLPLQTLVAADISVWLLPSSTLQNLLLFCSCFCCCCCCYCNCCGNYYYSECFDYGNCFGCCLVLFFVVAAAASFCFASWQRRQHCGTVAAAVALLVQRHHCRNCSCYAFSLPAE